MNTNTQQRVGVEAQVGWTVGHAPLWLRGIRCAENGDGGNGGAGGTPPAAPAAPAPPAPAAPAAPATVAPGTIVDGYSPDYVKGLREEAKGHRERGEKTAAELAAVATERDELRAKVAAFEQAEAARERTGKITTAAKDIADAELLLDSQAFNESIAEVDVNDDKALAAAVSAFVEKHPRFAVQQGGGKPAPRQHGAPAGGGHKGAAQSLGGAIRGHYAN